MSGWTGSSLLVELDKPAAKLFDRPTLRASFLGGRGYGVALLAELGLPDASPLDPRQPFVLAAGPLTGTSAPSSGRFAAVAPSPLTGTIFDSNAGGRFGVRLRAAGLDALVLRGAAPGWSVLVVDGRGGAGQPRADESAEEGSAVTAATAGRVERPPGGPAVSLLALSAILPGLDAQYQGLTSSRLVEALRAVLGPGFSLVFPSVAGRHGALLGSLRTDDRRNLGRGGLGAALSAKRVFAVAVAGDSPPLLADEERFSFLVYEAGKLLEANPVTSRALPQFGTAVLMQLVNSAGALPTFNYQRSRWDGVDALSGETVREQLVRGRQGCFGCRIRCTPRMAGSLAGPEYETLWAFGPACGVDDLEAVQEANRLCGEYGLDTISAGATIACAMELGERGRLGRTLRFGQGERVVELVTEMGEGRGFGAELADGSARLAARYHTADAAVHSKGLELPGYDPRGMMGQGLAYATSNRGGCHLRGNMLGPEVLGIPKLLDRREPAGKSGILMHLQHLSAVYDSACACKFVGFAYGEELLARLVQAATGDELSADDLLRSGERTWTLERLWNLAAGFTRADDSLPARLGLPLASMLDEYFRARGWSREGVPGERKVRSLGLVETAASLRARAGEPPAAREGQGWRTDWITAQAEAQHGPPRPAEAVPPPKGGGRHLQAV